jgi:hypothetical protein
MSVSPDSTRGFLRPVALGCCAMAFVALGAAHFLEQNADQQVAKLQQGATPARGLAALPRPQSEQQAQGSWLFGRRTDASAVGTAAPPKVGNTITNPELGMPR